MGIFFRHEIFYFECDEMRGYFFHWWKSEKADVVYILLVIASDSFWT